MVQVCSLRGCRHTPSLMHAPDYLLLLIVEEEYWRVCRHDVCHFSYRLGLVAGGRGDSRRALWQHFEDTQPCLSALAGRFSWRISKLFLLNNCLVAPAYSLKGNSCWCKITLHIHHHQRLALQYEARNVFNLGHEGELLIWATYLASPWTS